MNNIYDSIFLAPIRLMLTNTPPEMRTRLYLSFIPAALVAATCTAVIFTRRKQKDGFWYSALATSFFLALKIFTVWIFEPYALMVPFFGIYGSRILSLGILLPEGLIFTRYLAKGEGLGAPYLQMANYCIPLGSIFVGSLIGFALGNKSRGAGK